MAKKNEIAKAESASLQPLEKFENWKSQIAISIPTENMSSQNARTSNPDMLSQIAMTSAKRRPLSALPYAFTENGVAMLSGMEQTTDELLSKM